VGAAHGLPVFDVDPYDAALLRAPVEYYRALRALGPLVWIPRYGVCASGHISVVEPAFRDWRRFCSSRGVGLTDFASEAPWRAPSIILEVDPPAHERTRRVMARALSPQAVRALQPRFEQVAARLVDEALAGGHIDGVTALAAAFPLEVFGDAVGVARAERDKLLTYGNMVFDALGPDNAVRRASLAYAAEVVPWITARCAREALSDDGFGAAIYAAAEHGEVSSEEASLLVRSLLSAGVDTTVATLANLLHCFATHPAQWQLLRAEPGLLGAAIDEVLRYESPVHTFCRTSTERVEFEQASMPADTKLLCVMGAANRDPARWEQADTFDIRRPSRPHVAFGSGIHVCVGQHVARQEITAVLGALVARVARLELAGEARWRVGNAVHTLQHLPLTLHAA
jgi:hypothetical protein